ncbi:MAG: ATP synthase F1 subunit delta [Firmicutes bacterium]|jgi:F-type H+-transporting ATPase subunit delta|nr:ATP synthase F1 subunit delta [Bacillota bacterium]
MSTNIAAKRYANAFFRYVKKHGPVDEVYTALQRLQGELNAEPRLLEFLKHPGITRAEKEAFITDQLAAYTVWVQRLLIYVIDQGRAELLPDIIQGFLARYKDEEGIAEVEVVTATELDGAMRNKVIQFLEKKLRKRVVAKTIVEPQLIGGLVIRHGGMVYDGSVRTMLQQVKRRLGGGIGL